MLSAENWAAFKTLRLEALDAHPEAFGSSFEEEFARTEDEWKAEFKRSDLFGFFEKNKLVAVAGFFVYSSLKMCHRGVLWGMYIQPDYRRKGIAVALLKTVIAHAQKRVTQLHLTVVTHNQAAVKLYEKNGFRIYGTEPQSLKVGTVFHDEHLMVLEF